MKDMKVRLGKVTLEFGTNGSLTDKNIIDFFSCVNAIDVLTIRGLVGEITENLQYVNNKLAECGVFVGKIDTEVLV